VKKKLIIATLVVLLTFSACIWTPTTSSNKVKTVRIGVIAPYEDSLNEYTRPFFEEIIEPDINSYMAKLPKERFLPQLKFEFLYDHADFSPDGHLEAVQRFHEMGVDLLIGGFWSSQAAGSLDYIDANDILLVSPSSTAPALAEPNDNLFRIAPDDNNAAMGIAEMLMSYGVENVAIIQRNDMWGGGQYETFVNAYSGDILTLQLYDPEEDPEDYDFSEYLDAADTALLGKPNAGVLIISFEEAAILIDQAEGYDVYDLPWFGSEGTAKSSLIIKDSGEHAAHLGIYSPLAAPTYSSKFHDLSERYKFLIGEGIGFYTAAEMDAAWIIAMSVLETKPSFIPKWYRDAPNVIDVLPDVASRYFGYTGWCLLNEAGDRYAVNYEIWGYYEPEQWEYDFKVFGYYNYILDEVVWYP